VLRSFYYLRLEKFLKSQMKRQLFFGDRSMLKFWMIVQAHKEKYAAAVARRVRNGETATLIAKQTEFNRTTSTSTAPTSSDQHPLFTFAVTYLQNIQEGRGFVSNNSHQHKPSSNASPQAPGARYKPSGLELAAAASTTPAATSSPPASTAFRLRARIRTSMKARPSI
jgi:hypothetical protein